VNGARSSPETIWLLPLRDSGLNSSTEKPAKSLGETAGLRRRPGSTYSVSTVGQTTRDCLDMLSTCCQIQPASDFRSKPRITCWRRSIERFRSNSKNSKVTGLGDLESASRPSEHTEKQVHCCFFNDSVGTVCAEMKSLPAGRANRSIPEKSLKREMRDGLGKCFISTLLRSQCCQVAGKDTTVATVWLRRSRMFIATGRSNNFSSVGAKCD
jgi:hypothetical protein